MKEKDKAKTEERVEEQVEEKEEKLTEEEQIKKIQEALDQLTTKDIVSDMIISLSSLAFKKMGLPEETNKKHRDLDQAKQAIDCLDGMINGIEPALEANELQMFKTTLANIKMAYVKESEKNK
jgi:hypothetical protein